MSKDLSIYWDLIKLQIKAQFQYRGALNLLFFAKLIGFGFGYVVIYILLSKFKTIAGWSLYEILFLQSLSATAYAISSAFFHNPGSQLSRQVQTGEFDAILIRPTNNLFYYMFRVFSTGYLGNITLSLSVLIFSIYKLQITFNIIKFLFLIVVILGASLIQGAFYIIAAVPSFWIIKGNALTLFMLYDSASFIRYPISAYNKAIQIFITFIVPYAFINFYPAQFFLNKNDSLMFHPCFQFCTPLVGILLFFLAYRFWKIGINHYQSSGS